MITIKRIFPIFIALICVSSLSAQNDWRITGDAVNGNPVVCVQNPNNNQEFVFVGKLSNQYFKITDGVDRYVVNCGDNDPLEQTLTLRRENDPSETGLRIRYVAHNEFFKVTIKATRSTTQIVAERLVPPQSLYIMGGPFNHHDPNWLLEDAIEMERDADNPFVFYYRGEIRYNTFGDERGSIKFLLGKTWDNNYHPVGSTNVLLLQASKMRLNGADTKWTIPENRSGDGNYVIKLNTLEETIEVDFTSETGIDPVKQDDKIKVFATEGKVFIRSDEPSDLRVDVFGIDGRKVAREVCAGNTGIALPRGCYVVKTINRENKTGITKVIV
ncbi:MAG: hypothetical protein EZS26_000886 [Candidatus Ordinivivax streblomastigis]|uniref:T9SS C-terminal target domain-containing protein n=1 Tax=Candidatus Ordinivivax streblomastigis TaxID=2540710 RepID=A0A5M8P3L1_9BACT|nr:MAG: hypothetical protein EZS26_000886 [Candidatus Ordinivivax streblomastigis]